MEHNLSKGIYTDRGKEITAQQYEEGKAFYLKVREYAVRVFSGEMQEAGIPEKYRAKVVETVEIMRMPSTEKPDYTVQEKAAAYDIIMGEGEG